MKGTKAKTLTRKKSRARESLHSRRARSRAVRARTEQQYYGDMEELLVRNISKKIEKQSKTTSSLFPHMLHNMTASARMLAYKSGFSVGRNLFLGSGESTNAVSLINALESAGLGRVMYSPFSDRVVVTAKHTPSEHRLNHKTHVFEAGLIAGYLSASSGRNITVSESHCIQEDSDFCQFVAKPGEMGVPEEEEITAYNSLNDLADAFASRIYSVDFAHRVRDEYYVLSILPFIQERVQEEASKVLYLVGKRIGAGKSAIDDKKFAGLADVIGASTIKIVKMEGNKPKLIRLKYKPSNSFKSYTDLSAALVVGILENLYGTKLQVVRRVNSDRSYTLDLLLE